MRCCFQLNPCCGKAPNDVHACASRSVKCCLLVLSVSCRVSWFLLPVCFLAAVLNYLDRTNLAFAALELNADLGFTPVVSHWTINVSNPASAQLAPNVELPPMTHPSNWQHYLRVPVLPCVEHRHPCIMRHHPAKPLVSSELSSAAAAAAADVQDYGIGAGQCCCISQEFATSSGLFAQQTSSSAVHTAAHPADQWPPAAQLPMLRSRQSARQGIAG